MNAEVTKEEWKDKDVEVQRAESGGTSQSRLACSAVFPETCDPAGCGSGTASRERCG